MTDPYQELQKVLNGEEERANILHLSKRSGYHLFRVKEIVAEMGLAYVGAPGTQDQYWVTLPTMPCACYPDHCTEIGHGDCWCDPKREGDVIIHNRET